MNTEILQAHYKKIFSSSSKYVLMWMNIKNFRYYNTKYDYDQGTEILHLIEQKLQSLLQPHEICRRIFADNYISLLCYEDIQLFLHGRLTKMVDDLYRIDDPRLYRELFLSFGLVELTDETLSFDNACNQANLARRQELRFDERNHNIELYNDQIYKEFMDRNELEIRTAEAYKNNEFIPYVQPKVDLQTNKIVGAETLLRWFDKDGKMIPLYKFLPILNQNGYIHVIDVDTFNVMCNILQERIDHGKPVVPLSFNISKTTFYDDHIIDNFVNIFKQYQLSHTLIEMEFMESISLDDTKRLKEIIKGFRDVGFACSLDDFGNGYSSFNVLLNADLNTVKMDRQFFLKNLNGDSRLIIKTIIHLIKSLHMKIVAEGVELQEHIDFLKECGCDMVQGYYYYKPMSVDAFYELLDQQEKSI